MEDYDTPDDFAEEIDSALNYLFLLRLETHDHGVVVTRQSCFISLKWTCNDVWKLDALITLGAPQYWTSQK